MSRLPARKAPMLLGAVGLVFTAILAVAGGADALAPAHHSSPAQLQSYEQQLVPLVKDWGSIEVLGMRPAIADLRAGAALGRPAIVATEARAWRASLVRDRGALIALHPPAELAGAEQLLDRAMASYLQATDLFLAATKVQGSGRAEFIEQGIHLVSSGSRTYDDASAAIQRVLRARGLVPDPAWGAAS